MFNYFKKQRPNYLSEVLYVTTDRNFQLGSGLQKLKCPFLITANILSLILVKSFRTKPLAHSSVVTTLIPSNIIWKISFRGT